MLPDLNSFVENIPEALSIFVNQIVYEKKSRGERVYTYSLGEAFSDIPQFPISDSDMKSGYHYSDSMGLPVLREKIAGMYRRRYGAAADAQSEIVVSAGSKPLIFMVLKACLCEGEEAAYHEPAWLSYPELIRLAGGKRVAIPYYEEVRQWENYLSDKTKVLIVNNPNNPSGKLYTRDEMEYLLDLARQKNFFILADEAYSDFLMAKDRFISFAELDEEKEHVIVVNSLSKNMGISGWRVGYTISHRDVAAQLLKLNQHLITCAATVLQEYMAKHFDQILEATIPQAQDMAAKRKEVRKIMDRMGMHVLEGTGTFYFLIDVSAFPGQADDLVFDLLFNHNIAAVPGGAYGESTKRFIRFGIGTESVEDIERSLFIIKKYLDLKEYDAAGIRMKIEEYIKQRKGG